MEYTIIIVVIVIKIIIIFSKIFDSHDDIVKSYVES